MAADTIDHETSFFPRAYERAVIETREETEEDGETDDDSERDFNVSVETMLSNLRMMSTRIAMSTTDDERKLKQLEGTLARMSPEKCSFRNDAPSPAHHGKEISLDILSVLNTPAKSSAATSSRTGSALARILKRRRLRQGIEQGIDVADPDPNPEPTLESAPDVNPASDVIPERDGNMSYNDAKQVLMLNLGPVRRAKY